MEVKTCGRVLSVQNTPSSGKLTCKDYSGLSLIHAQGMTGQTIESMHACMHRVTHSTGENGRGPACFQDGREEKKKFLKCGEKDKNSSSAINNSYLRKSINT